MADKRIYNFTDTQNDYSADLYLAADSSLYSSGAKKVKMGTIYKKIEQLAVATGITQSAWLLRLNNGSGAEYQVTIDDFFNLLPYSSTSYVPLYDVDGRIMGNLYLARYGKMVNAIFYIKKDWGGAEYQLYTDIYGNNKLILPSEYIPVETLKVWGERDQGSDQVNYVKITSPGGAVYAVATKNADDNVVSISYVTA